MNIVLMILLLLTNDGEILAAKGISFTSMHDCQVEAQKARTLQSEPGTKIYAECIDPNLTKVVNE